MDKISFKEHLTLEADMNELKIDISDKIDHIKDRMKSCVNYRSFVISLVKANVPMAIGGNCGNAVDYFIPSNIAPRHYRQLFVNEFIKLGFAEDDIELSISETSCGTFYNIVLTW